LKAWNRIIKYCVSGATIKEENMVNKNTETSRAQENQSVKNAVPAWVSILALAITALIAGFVLMRI